MLYVIFLSFFLLGLCLQFVFRKEFIWSLDDGFLILINLLPWKWSKVFFFRQDYLLQPGLLDIFSRVLLSWVLIEFPCSFLGLYPFFTNSGVGLLDHDSSWDFLEIALLACFCAVHNHGFEMLFSFSAIVQHTPCPPFGFSILKAGLNKSVLMSVYSSSATIGNHSNPSLGMTVQ